MNGNNILEKLFTSRARVKLLSTLVMHPDRSYFMRELARETGETFSNIRKEIKNLEELKIITGEQNSRAKYYIINTEHYLYPELKGLVVKTEEAVTSDPPPALSGKSQGIPSEQKGDSLYAASNKPKDILQGTLHQDWRAGLRELKKQITLIADIKKR